MLCPTSAEVGSLVRLCSCHAEARSQPRLGGWHWAQPPVLTSTGPRPRPAPGSRPRPMSVRTRGSYLSQWPYSSEGTGDLSMAWVRLRHDGCYLNAECVGLHDKLISDINCLQSRVNTMAMLAVQKYKVNIKWVNFFGQLKSFLNRMFLFNLTVLSWNWDLIHNYHSRSSETTIYQILVEHGAHKVIFLQQHWGQTFTACPSGQWGRMNFAVPYSKWQRAFILPHNILENCLDLKSHIKHRY